MRFGLFGGARTELGEQASDSRIYTDYIDYICEAEALGFHSVFLVEHHFTGFGQVSATLNFLTYLAAKTTVMRLGTAVLVLPWHNPALLAEQLHGLQETLGLDGILAELNTGGRIPHDCVVRALQLLCQEVMPRFH